MSRPRWFLLFVLLFLVWWTYSVLKRGTKVREYTESNRQEIEEKVLSPVKEYETVVFNPGEQQKVHYRIPVLGVGPLHNTLVVVAEQRLGTVDDDTEKNIVYRWSEDAGQTWSQQRTLFASPDNNNVYAGSLLVDQEAGSMIYLLPYCQLPCPGGKRNRHTVWTTYQFTSTDNGRSWSEPRNISHMVGTERMFGPNNGVQKRLHPHPGRLVACGHTMPQESGGIWCVTSDDHGLTWQRGLSLHGWPHHAVKKPGDFKPDENNLVELADGSLLINARNQFSWQCKCRISIRSLDGGGPSAVDVSRDVWVNRQLPDPRIAGGLVVHQGVLLYAGVNSTTHREKLVLHWSRDSGVTWSEGVMLWGGKCAYASMAAAAAPRHDSSAAAAAAPRHDSSAADEGRVFVAYEKQRTIVLAAVRLFGNT